MATEHHAESLPQKLARLIKGSSEPKPLKYRPSQGGYAAMEIGDSKPEKPLRKTPIGELDSEATKIEGWLMRWGIIPSLKARKFLRFGIKLNLCEELRDSPIPLPDINPAALIEQISRAHFNSMIPGDDAAVFTRTSVVAKEAGAQILILYRENGADMNNVSRQITATIDNLENSLKGVTAQV